MEPLKRILIVEDEPAIQNIIRLALLSSGGFVLKTCKSGAEAISAVRLFPPDLILLDVMMEGFDGIITLKALRRIPQTENTPVIFVTAKTSPEDMDLYKAMGANGVIPKPFDPITFSNLVKKIWWKTVPA